MELIVTLEAHTRTSPNNSGWAVARCLVSEGIDGCPVSIAAAGGLLAHAGVGEQLRLSGEFQNHPRFGDQFQVDTQVSMGIPSPRNAYRWLERLDGVGPVIAGRLSEKYGDQIREALARPLEAEDELTSLRGISQAVAKRIKESWSDIGLLGDSADIEYLDGIQGMTPWRATAVLEFARKKKGISPQKLLEDRPYELIGAKGLGFLTVDEIALSSGTNRTCPMRIEAAAHYYLEEWCAQKGHTYAPRGLFTHHMGEVLNLDTGTVSEALGRLMGSGAVVQMASPSGKPCLHPSRLLEAERECYAWTREAPARPDMKPLNLQAIVDMGYKHEDLGYTHPDGTPTDRARGLESPAPAPASMADRLDALAAKLGDDSTDGDW